MNLYSRPFVRETRARVLDFLRHHPALWNDYKRHRKWFDLPRKQAVSGIRIAWLVAAFLVFLSRSRPDLPLVVLALYCTGTVIFRSRSLRISLYGPGNIAIFNGLPIAEKDFFQIQWKKFIWRSLSLLVIATIVYLSSSSRFCPPTLPDTCL